jgi:predicted TIM-barrel fold metal-dependent hydrolase
MRNGFALFDTHTHVGAAAHSGRRYAAEQLLREMDRAGIDRSLVIPFPVVTDYRAAHDEIGRAVLSFGDRLTGAASLNPLVGSTEFRSEVRRCRELYGFRALKLQPQYQPLNPACPGSDFLFETALENRLTFICHTGSGIPFTLPSALMLPARKFPELQIVIAHGGGGGLFVGEAVVAAAFCPNIFIELSSLMPHHVLEILQSVGSDRLMVGSDLPENLDTEIGKILGLTIPDEDKRNILHTTAARVFRGCPEPALHCAPERSAG